MKNLGKLLFIISLLSSALYAGVVGSVDAQDIERGDVVTFSLKLSGEDIQRPNLFELCGFDVISTAETRSIQMINNKTTTDYTLTYRFEPTKNCVIEPVEVIIDGKKELTSAIDISVKKVVPSKDDDFSLSLFINKNEVYVGESFELVLMLKQKKSAKIVDNKFIQPDLKGFWIKGDPKQERGEDSEYIVTKVTYALAAQRVGKLDISAAQMKIASRKKGRNFFGGFFPEVKWKNYFSNELSITAKALPDDVKYIGDFAIQATVDKKVANANEAVNVTIQVLGDGNLEDIKTFKPYIEGVSIFDEKSVVDNNRLSQKIAFVADESFTVEPFTLKFLDTKSNKVKTIATQPINIKVQNAKVKQDLVIKRDNNQTVVVPQTVTTTKALDKIWLGVAFVVGLILGMLIMFIWRLNLFFTKKSFNIKDHKMLLVKLMPFRDNEDVKDVVDALESNLYSKTQKIIENKQIKALVKKYEIN